MACRVLRYAKQTYSRLYMAMVVHVIEILGVAPLLVLHQQRLKVIPAMPSIIDVKKTLA